MDTNELNSINAGFNDIQSDVEGHGVMTDYQLTEFFDDVILLDDVIQSKDTQIYNESQLKLFSNADGFVAMGGGSTLLCCLFNKPTISYFTTSIECGRQDYFGEDNYYRKLCDKFYPILDNEDSIKSRGEKDYTEMIKKIKEVL